MYSLHFLPLTCYVMSIVLQCCRLEVNPCGWSPSMRSIHRVVASSGENKMPVVAHPRHTTAGMGKWINCYIKVGYWETPRRTGKGSKNARALVSTDFNIFLFWKNESMGDDVIEEYMEFQAPSTKIKWMRAQFRCRGSLVTPDVRRRLIFNLITHTCIT